MSALAWVVADRAVLVLAAGLAVICAADAVRYAWSGNLLATIYWVALAAWNCHTMRGMWRIVRADGAR